MKILLIISLILFTFSFIPLFAQQIPEKLEKLGFTEYTLISYEKEDNIGYFTFSDWRTEEKSDTVTFVVVDGKIKEWFKDKKVIKLETKI